MQSTKQFLIIIITVLFFTSCGGSSNGSNSKTKNNVPGSNQQTDELVTIEDDKEADLGSLTFKVDGTLYTCKPETVGSFFTQHLQKGSFKGVVDENTSISMSYSFDSPTGEIPKKFGENITNSPKLKLNGVVYYDPQNSYDVKVVVTHANEVSKGVYSINGTFEGSILDRDGKVVHTITEGKFISPKNKVML